MKKFVVLCLMVACFGAAGQGVFAKSLDSLVQKAMRLSSEYKDGVDTLRKSRLSGVEETKLKSKPAYSIGVDSGKWNITEDNFLVFTPNIDFASSANSSDNPLSFSVGFPISLKKDNNISLDNYGLSFRASKTFNLSGTESNRTKLSLKKYEGVQAKDESKYDLEFASKFYTELKKAMTSSLSLKKAEQNYNKKKADYDADLALGNITENTADAISRKSDLGLAELDYNIAKLTYASSLSTFKEFAGFIYEEPDFTEFEDEKYIQRQIRYDFRILDGGNTECKSKQYDYLIAKNELNMIAGGGYELGLNLNAGMNIDKEDSVNNSQNASVSAKLSSSSNFNAAIELGEKHTTTKGTAPYLGFSFKFYPDSTLSINQNEVEQKEIEVRSKYLDYQSQLNDYQRQATKMQGELKLLQNEFEVRFLKYKYYKEKYENNKQLAELGYKSESQKIDDELEFLQAKYDYYSSIMDLLVCIINAKILNM